MKLNVRSTLLLCSLFAVLAAGCGATIGDACTTEADCGGQFCQNANWTPGGYCTKQCTVGVDSSCPGGSLCVSDVISKDNPGCLRTCNANSDCRPGYTCRVVRNSSRAVCVGPDGI